MRKSCQEFVFPSLFFWFFFLALFSWKYAEKIKRIYADFALPRKITGLTVAFTQLWNSTLFISQWDKVALQLGTPVKPHLPFFIIKKKVLRNLYFCNYFSKPSPLGHLVQEVAQFPQLLNKTHHRLGDPSTSILLSEFLWHEGDPTGPLWAHWGVPVYNPVMGIHELTPFSLFDTCFLNLLPPQLHSFLLVAFKSRMVWLAPVLGSVSILNLINQAGCRSNRNCLAGPR